MRNNRHKINLKMLLILGVFSATFSYSVPFTRMDLFDKSGNNLLFVEFQYDNTGKNIGRSIYASDSTFLRRTTFTNDAAGKRTREQSFNFNDDTIGYTLFSSQNDKPTINVFDQLSLDHQFDFNQFGASVSYASNGTNTFDIYHNGKVVYKMKYTYLSEGSELNRIDVLDNSNAVLYYATFSSSVHTAKPSVDRILQPSLKIFRDRCHMIVSLQKKSQVRVCIYNLSGKLVTVPFQENMKAGLQSVQFRIGLSDGRKLANTLYIIRLSVDGQITASSQKYLGNMGRGQ
jgi:hypothetical protein